ncbi:pyridoxamine 5'-phosphate oxidase-domain-containing protein [Kockiozyma suomiensis]|uniref:pyridoxamine 5'-phosphate oxidase-domain-containing protein n=1 Tax=Kockiozyma suomiensis TaxID=1337062 RepID=UPI003342FC4B
MAHLHSHGRDPLVDTAAQHNLENVQPPWVSMFKNFLRSAAPKQGSSNGTDSDSLPSYPFILSTVSVNEYTDDATGETTSYVRPHARTCMFRGFAFGTNSGILNVTTDKRMAKFSQLTRPSTHGAFEACFYFEGDLVQFRISGACKLVYLIADEVYLSDPEKGTEESAQESIKDEFYKAWDALSPGMKLSFCKPPPGAEFNQEHFEVLQKIEKITEEVHSGKDIPEEYVSEGQHNFVLILCGPELVDFVNVSGIGQRILFSRAGEYVWTFQEICP